MSNKEDAAESNGTERKRRAFLQTVAASSFVSVGLSNATAADSPKPVDDLLVSFDQLDGESQRLFQRALKQDKLEIETLPQDLRDYPFVAYRGDVYSTGARHVRNQPTETVEPAEVRAVPDRASVVSAADLPAEARRTFENARSQGRVEAVGGLPDDLSFVEYVRSGDTVYETNFVHREGKRSLVLSPSVVENFGGEN